MIELATTIGFAIGLFVATNVDEIVVLIAFFADDRFTRRQVWLGHLAGSVVLIGLSLAGALLSLAVRQEFLGVLGAVPIVLGITKLIDRDDDDDDELGDSHAPRAGSRLLAVIAVTMASGGDNVGAYVPIFGTRSRIDIAVIVAVFVVMMLVWCWACSALVRHPRVGPQVRRIAQWVTPFVFIGLGVLIFFESGAYELVFR